VVCITPKGERASSESQESAPTWTLDGISSTAEIPIPKDPLKRVIGQDDAIKLARIAANQRRHLMLVGPPGTGKSMIAQALSLHLHRPTEEIRVVQNPENPERPLIEVKSREEAELEQKTEQVAGGELIEPKAAPVNVAERLGFKCVTCGTYSTPKERFCPKCTRPKMSNMSASPNNPFGDLLGGLLEVTMGAQAGHERVTTTRKRFGKDEVVVYERAGEMVRILDQKALEHSREMDKLSPRKVIVPVNRNPFVLATGASEVELLGDVRHDPYGGHPTLGTQPYERVLPGAIHEAHQGVLFVDELPHLAQLQRYLLTAMQEKRFPIVGRNPQSAGASVRVDNVPCDFIFVGACNIQDLQYILSPLRSRIIGSGYEVLVETAMPDTEENRFKLAQFVAQEIIMDGRIPHANVEALDETIKEAGRRAQILDRREKGLTLRLRELGGLVRTAGDIATVEGHKLITAADIQDALKRAKSIEEQIKDRYGSYQSGVASDMTGAQKQNSPYHYWNQHTVDDKKGYL
jgi:ATP-dependent Lon protease